MRIVSADALGALETDVCVVGCGPVGLAVAARAGRAGLRVLLLDAGRGRARRADLLPADDALSPTQAPANLATASGLGGTTQLWGGRCLPLDPIDLAGSVHGKPWPLAYEDVSRFFPATAEFLGCGPATFTSETAESPAALGDLEIDRLERWCREPDLSRRLAALDLGPQVSICLGVAAVGGTADRASSALRSLDITDGASRRQVHARRFVLAAGGLESVRLLLALRSRYPDLFGGASGVLGRGYMGHLSGSIADIAFADPAVANLFAFAEGPGSAVRRRLTLAEAALKREGLPNIAFYPANPRLAEASHGRGALSALYLLLATPGVGRRLLPEAILQMQTERPSPALAHIRNVFTDAKGVGGLVAALIGQGLRGRRRPLLLIRSRSGRYPLHYHAEHRPNDWSTATLAEEPDCASPARLRVDLRFDAQDAQGVVRAHERLDAMLRETGLGQLVFRSDPEARVGAVLGQARDGFHQIGLARMGLDESDGIVDRDCRTFSLSNLYLAGSAVFPTSGQANPTFFATALAMRLGDHLAAEHRLQAAA